MSDYYNINCPKGYGKIVFLQNNSCPISGMLCCVDCDVIYASDVKDGQVIKREKQKENKI